MMDGAFFSFLEDEQQQQAPDEDAALQVAKLKVCVPLARVGASELVASSRHQCRRCCWCRCRCGRALLTPLDAHHPPTTAA
jgi:hypothetical protein